MKRLTRGQLQVIEARMLGCPFCGSSDVHAEHGSRGLVFQCDTCLADVCFDPFDARTSSENLARWNRRDYFKTLDKIAEEFTPEAIPDQLLDMFAETMEEVKNRCDNDAADCKGCPCLIEHGPGVWRCSEKKALCDDIALYMKMKGGEAR